MSKPISQEEKASALRRVLGYPPIAESAILSRFVQFVGEKAIHNDSEPLKEYVIATEVFHKPKDFDPRVDPIVRVHAGRLRKKLNEYFQREGAHNLVKVVMPKGAYTLQFVRPGWRWLLPVPIGPWVSVALGLATVVLALVVFFRAPSRLTPHAPVAERDPSAGLLLAPFLDNSRRTVIVFSNDLYLKDNDGNMFRLKAEEKLDLLSRLQARPEDLLVSPSLRGAAPFYLEGDYTGVGEATCIFLLTRFFAERGKALEIRASGSFDPQELRYSNVIFLGSPRENLTLNKMIMPLDLRFVRRVNPAGRPFLAIENARPRAGEKALYEARLHPVRKTPQEVYALISFLPGLISGSHFLVLAGQSTGGTQSACEFLLDAGAIANLPAAWSKRGQIPRVYQVLLKTTIRDFVPIRTEYVTHHAGSDLTAAQAAF